MSDQQVTVNPKQLLAFLGGGVILVLLVLLFFFKSSGLETTSNNPTTNNNQPKVSNDSFLGDRGMAVEAIDGQIYIDQSEVDDGNMHSFNYYSERQKKTIYFFIIKASDGTYRAAANACEVCFEAKKGFTQVGDLIRCENCQVTYSKDKIALEKGGCNPGPIDKNVKVENGQLVIQLSDVEGVAYLF